MNEGIKKDKIKFSIECMGEEVKFLDTNMGEIHYHKGKQNKWSKQIEFSAESNQFEKKSML